MAENALLRQQLIILRRHVKQPAFKKSDRMLLVLLARAVRTWKQALFIAQPATLLRWHRQGFQLYWKYKSRAVTPKLKISTETVVLIKEMARDNRLWGAERIRGEWLKLGIRVCTRTIQKYMRPVRTAKPRGQNWKTFLHTHAEQIWACDFLPVTDLFFRSLFAFFIIELHSRKVNHIGVTRSPSDAWTAHQLREATAFGEGPKYLIRDHDGKFGVGFARVAKMRHIEMLTIPYHARRANAICERFLGSVRRELILRNLQARGYDVHVAADTHTVLAQLQAISFDLVLLDICLPDQTGWEMLHEGTLRPQERDGRKLPVVVLSAVPVSPRRPAEFRPFAYLPKPFPLDSPSWLLRSSVLFVERMGEVARTTNYRTITG